MLTRITVLLSILLFGACSSSNNPVGTFSGGDIYGKVQLYDEYNQILGDFSGVTVLLVKDTALFKSTTSAVDGSYRFNNVPAGVYTVRVTKTDYAFVYGDKDTASSSREQFVGTDSWEINVGPLKRKKQIDTSFWAMSELKAEVITDTTTSMGWVQTKEKDSTGHSFKKIYITFYHIEKSVRLSIGFLHPLPKEILSRKVTLVTQDSGTINPINELSILPYDSKEMTWIIRQPTCAITVDSTGAYAGIQPYPVPIRKQCEVLSEVPQNTCVPGSPSRLTLHSNLINLNVHF